MDNKKEMVNHPDHYNHPIECLDAIEMAYGTMAVYHFCLCNAMKYRWRAGYKDSKEQDLEKALWYQEKSHDYLQKLCHGPNKVFPAIMDFEH